jgi:hypothetical protein
MHVDGVTMLEMALWGRMGRWVLVTKDGVLFSTGKVLRPGRIR